MKPCWVLPPFPPSPPLQLCICVQCDCPAIETEGTQKEKKNRSRSNDPKARLSQEEKKGMSTNSRPEKPIFQSPIPQRRKPFLSVAITFRLNIFPLTRPNLSPVSPNPSTVRNLRVLGPQRQQEPAELLLPSARPPPYRTSLHLTPRPPYHPGSTAL